MNFLMIGLLLFGINTSFAILGMIMNTRSPNTMEFFYELNSYVYGGIVLSGYILWTVSFILIVIGLIKRRSKRLKKKEDELQELKDKVARLEHDKEKKD